MKENDFQPHLNLKVSSQTYLGEVKIKAELLVCLPPLRCLWAKHSAPKHLCWVFSDQTVDVLFSFPALSEGFCCCCRLCGRICRAWLPLSPSVHPFNLMWCCGEGQGFPPPAVWWLGDGSGQVCQTESTSALMSPRSLASAAGFCCLPISATLGYYNDC